ncbi:MAG: apolipoprotein N-acyltransferase [Candidatus Aminicenantes bacterium]|nr:apolipoprotein N-acyltransferase [Candidatus Aminicenantes bacterium]
MRTPRAALWTAAALLYGLSFPKAGLFPLAFVFLLPLLRAVEGRTPGSCMRIFFCFSFVSYLILLYWIPRVMVTYGGTTWLLGIVGLASLAAFLSLIAGLAGVLIARAASGGAGFAAAFWIPTLWVAKDLFIEKIISGFPWCLAGYSQYRNTWFIQWAELGGIHLLTFLLIAANILFYLLLKRRKRKNVLALAAFLVVVHAGGFLLLRNSEARRAAEAEHLAGIVQPNSDHDRPFYFTRTQATLDRLFGVSGELARDGAEFVVWPEFTVPIYPRQSPYYKEQFTHFARWHAPLLAGFTDQRGSAGVFNSVMLFHKGGIETYDKVHLTPFGEYIPFRRWLFFVRKITDEIGDFTPGAEIHNLALNGHRLSTPVCYEIIYPELVRSMIDRGGEAIVTLSNDSWFGDTSAPRQHLAMATLRSVENRRWLLRSTSNGISALVDPAGRIVRRVPLRSQREFLARFQYLDRKTFFTRWGYLFPYACLLLVLGWLLGSLPGKKRPPTSPAGDRKNRRRSRSAQSAPGGA